MREWKTGNKKRKKDVYNGRINIILAVIFLLGASMVYKLYDVQIQNYELYEAMASGQHRVSIELKPERGKIYMQNREKNRSDSEGILEGAYPLATNKDYALVYAIPKELNEVAKRKEYALKIYEVFDKEKIVKEVDEHFKQKDREKLREKVDNIPEDLSAEEKKAREEKINVEFEALKKTDEWLEDRKRAKKRMIEERKEEKIEKYMKIYEKPDDPYEPLKKKVEKQKAKELYASILSSEKEKVAPEELVLKDREILKKQKDTSEEDTSGEKPIKIEGVSHFIESYRYYPEEKVGANLLGFVNYGNGKGEGSYGLEGFFDKELSGEYGSTVYDRGTGDLKDAIIVNDREYVEPKNGEDLVLTIDGAIQFASCKKLKDAINRYGATGGNVVAVDPSTGEIISMCSYPSFDPNNYGKVKDIQFYNNPVVFEQYEPGSVFKTITMAAALNEEAVTPQTNYVDKGRIKVQGWDGYIKNSDYATKGAHEEVDMNYVLEHSLNTGAIHAMKLTGPNKFSDYVERFGFGQRTGIELEGEAKGDLRNLDKKNIAEVYAATASYGQGISVTPLQMVMSYAAIANEGILMKPFVVERIIKNGDEEDATRPVQIRRVISERSSELLSGMLVNVVRGGHAEKAGVDGYYVGGKTGTAQVASSIAGGYGKKTIHTFIGMAPIDDPKFVMLVKLDRPSNVRYSASSAAPLFGDIAEFILDYYKVPKER
ncbi:MAG: peptidoglycan D,D-transpeptidase FtsI family protein [Patescibacteria group bacterium]